MSKRDHGSRTNGFILGMIYMFVFLFVGLSGYMVWFTWKEAPDLVNNSYNGRLAKLNEAVVRGDILSADGKVLATTEVGDDGEETRIYPFKNDFAHVVGYTSVGTSGLEASAGYYLLNSHEAVLDRIYKEITNQKEAGDTVVTTLNSELQELISDAMEGYKGSCVVMDPTTGEILAMVSKDDFDPNTLADQYADIVSDDDNSSLVNRATQGLYTPGSTFKLVTALAYIRENPDTWKDFSYNCEGSITEGNHTINCAHGNSHGVVDLETALAKSCNCAFVKMGLTLSIHDYRETARDLMFNQTINTDLRVAKSKFDLTGSSGRNLIMQTVFGQGNTKVTPLLNCMIVSAIANKGVMMNPYLVSEVRSVDGRTVETLGGDSLGSVMTSKEASILSDMMCAVVNKGTGTVLQSSDYQAAAKTGSAETGQDKNTDAWMVAFAPADNPKIAVSIVLEEAGTGSGSGGPIIKKIFDAYLAD